MGGEVNPITRNILSLYYGHKKAPRRVLENYA